MMSKYLRTFFLIFCLQVFVQNAVFGQSTETQLLNYTYSGTGKPGASGPEFLKVMAHLEVQKALLEVAAEPRNQAFLEEALKGTGVTLEVLQTLRLIRRKGDTYVLAFSLFTSADLDKIRATAEAEGKGLAAALLSQRSEIQGILERNPQLGVDWKTRAFFILGCVSLDWDGLNLVREKGYLAVPEKGTYLPRARQVEGGGSVRQLYWGSHSMHDTIAVTSFGDHYSVPRHALPDLLWPLKDELRQMQAPESLKSKMVDAADALIRWRAGMMMLALRKSEKTSRQLAEASGITEVEANKLLELLLELNYVIAVDGRYRAIIPVLDEDDALMVKELRLIGRGVMLKWFDERYKALCQELSDITPVRYGVPLSEGFYTVWHYLFGIANRELVAAGLFADPYDASRVFKGFIPAVYLLHVVMGPY
jgi:DNA-binding transcriptional regulator/RsmH inhibitor MraZ